MTSIQTYLRKTLFKQSIVGLVGVTAVSLVATFFLSRHNISTDLQDLGNATLKSFRLKVLEGDIKGTELQLHDLLQLKGDERILILDKNFERLYKPDLQDQTSPARCEPIAETCYSSLFGIAQIFLPIYFDSSKENLFGYLYISKRNRINWSFFGTVFIIFVFGYLTVLLAASNATANSLAKLSKEIQVWSSRLERDPKSATPLSQAPFIELEPLKKSIEGLNEKIESYESQATHKAKLLILRGIAHDLLGPVAQLKMYLATLEKQIEESDQVKGTFIDLKDSLKKLSLIATQVKVLNNQDVRNSSIDFSSAVKEEIQSLEQSEEITKRNININLKVEDNISANMSQVDVSRIVQNLIHNAAHASKPNGEIKIEVSKINEHAQLKITDFGSGIPQASLNTVFDPTFTSKKGTGTGLGLSIVKHICDSRNGNITIQSAENIGTTVEVRIPAISSGEANAI
jgi:signal transduction histidine kinase